MSLVSGIVGLAAQALQLINTKEARKYADDLLDLDRKKEAMIAGPPNLFDSVEFVRLTKEIDRVSKAAQNDPAVFGVRPSA